MKEKVEAGDNKPLDMLMLKEGDVVKGDLMAPFILAVRMALHFLA
jgi:hypothetical protein